MKISCTRENLSRALSLVSGVTGKNVNLPILNNVLIKATDQKVEVAATNLELAMVVSLRSKIEEPGSFTVPARTLTDFVNLLPNENIDMELKENELVVRCGKSSTKIKGTSAEDFPVIPTMEGGEGFVVEAAELRLGLSQVLPAVAKNDIRPELAGIFFGFNSPDRPGLVMAATDSYRLAEKKVPLKQGVGEFKVVVPGRTAQEISHILMVADESSPETSARLLVGENQIMVNYGSTQLVSRLVEGQYPDYTQIIPKDFKTTTEVNTSQLVKEMKAAGLFTTSGVNAVSLVLKPSTGVIEITSTSTQTGEYSSEIATEIVGEENKVLLNNRYVLDGLNTMSADQVSLKMINGDSPCILTPKNDENYLYIVMPIRQ